MWTPAKIITDLGNNQTMAAIMGRNACKLATIDVCDEHSSTEIVSKIMKLCDYYAAKNSKFIAQFLFNSKNCLFFTKCLHINWFYMATGSPPMYFVGLLFSEQLEEQV